MPFDVHNQFRQSLQTFEGHDPHLQSLAKLRYQHHADWWKALPLDTPGLYILTGGRQVGKSTSCKQLIQFCLRKELFKPTCVFYLPCDEIYDAKQFSQTVRRFLGDVGIEKFLLIIDEVTFVKDWDRVIKALADEGCFNQGVCLLTGSDSIILKDAATRFPGRRGNADQTDFHLYPLSFREYVDLLNNGEKPHLEKLSEYFENYLYCGGYLRAINDLAEYKKTLSATLLTYEQWIRGDFLKQGKKETYLQAVLHALLASGVSQVSYSTLTQNIGEISKETCIDYCRLLERMDVLFDLQAFDQNKKQGFPKKARKFHFCDPFIYRVLKSWLDKELQLDINLNTSHIVEACVASHCRRMGRTFYFKGQGEIDIIWLHDKETKAIEVKWSEKLRSNDLKTLKHFKNSLVLSKSASINQTEGVFHQAIYEFLYDLGE